MAERRSPALTASLIDQDGTDAPQNASDPTQPHQDGTDAAQNESDSTQPRQDGPDAPQNASEPTQLRQDGTDATSRTDCRIRHLHNFAIVASITGILCSIVEIATDAFDSLLITRAIFVSVLCSLLLCSELYYKCKKCGRCFPSAESVSKSEKPLDSLFGHFRFIFHYKGKAAVLILIGGFLFETGIVGIIFTVVFFVAGILFLVVSVGKQFRLEEDVEGPGGKPPDWKEKYYPRTGCGAKG
jgi:hypothetical protein